VGSARFVLVRDLSLVKDTVMLQQVENQQEMQGLCQKCMSLVEDIVILLLGKAGGKCKARIGEGLVSCQRYCDATTGWKPVGNARFASKICISLVEDIVILLPGVASGKRMTRIGEGLVSCQRYCDATAGWKPEGNTRHVSNRCVSCPE
jgi:hypothetical protein